MPIIVDGSPDMTGRAIRLGGLPDFNAGDPDFVIEYVEGYMDGAAPQPVLVASGGGPGAVAVGNWAPAEEYLTVSGHIFAPRGDIALFRGMLLEAFTGEQESPLVILGGSVDVDKQMFVRLYDRRTLAQLDDHLSFTLPLVAPDPYKYALTPLAGDVGVFTGQTWNRFYDPATFARTYALSGSAWVRTYEQALPSGPYPPSVSLTSAGDAPSRRITATISGPLTAGDWWLVNESTDERLWVEVSVQESQQLVLDMRARTARLNGSPVDHLVFGDYLSLAPGGNTFRLVSGTASDAHAYIEALEAFQ